MRIGIAVVLSMLLMVPPAILSPAAAKEGSGCGATPREDIDLIDTFTLYSSGGTNLGTNGIYPGDTINCYFGIRTAYTGSMFLGPRTATNSSYLHTPVFSIEGFADADGNPIKAPLSWSLSAFRNNDGTFYTYTSPGSTYNVYATGGAYFKFSVNTTGVRPGQYFIVINIAAKVMTGYNGTTNWTYENVTDRDYVPFNIYSCVGPYSTTYRYNIVGMNEAGAAETIYAGARNEKIGIRSVSSLSGTLTEINASLSISDQRFQLISGRGFLMSTGSAIFWRVSVQEGTPPGLYDIGMQLTYKRNDVDISELGTLQRITVAYTPLLTLPGQSDILDPSIKIVQNTPVTSFTVPVKNEGNIPLTGILVRLDLDDASYFVNNEFYYDEDNRAQSTYIDSGVPIGDLAVGETKEVTFPDITIKNSLPPGRYQLPVDYMASYHSDGTLINSGNYTTGNWDEKNYNDYSTVIEAITDPEPSTTIIPFICVLVEDDARGIEVEAISSGTISAPGTRNANVGITVYNREKYAFTDCFYTVHTDQGSPLKNLYAPDNDPAGTLPATRRTSLSANSYDSFSFICDIKEKAAAGVNIAVIDFEGFTPYLQKVRLSLNASLTLGPAQPNILIIENSAQILGDGTGLVNLTVKNFGLGAAHNASAYLRLSSTTIHALTETVPLGDLAPEAAAKLPLKVVPTAESSSLSGTYSGTIYYQYIDDSGVLRRYAQGNYESVSFTFSLRVPDLVVTRVEAPLVTTGENFTVRLTVSNIGGSTALDVKAMIGIPNTALTLRGESTRDLGDLTPGAITVLSFDMSAAKDITRGTSYSLDVYLAYGRVDGRVLSFSEGDSDSFYVLTKEAVAETPDTRPVVEIEQSPKALDLSTLLAGILILTGIIIAALILRRKEPVPPPSPPPPEPARPAPPVERAPPVYPAQPTQPAPVDQPATLFLPPPPPWHKQPEELPLPPRAPPEEPPLE